MSPPPLIVFLIFGGGVIALLLALFGFLYVVELLRRGRKRALKRMAPLAGLQYEAEQSRMPEDAADSLAIARRGDDRVMEHHMRGELENKQIAVFDYHYVLMHNPNPRSSGFAPTYPGHERFSQTVALVELCDCEMPAFELREFDPYHQKAGLLRGFEKVAHEFEYGLPDDFMLSGIDCDAVRSVLTEGIVEEIAKERGLSADGGGRWLAVYRPSEVVDADGLKSFVEGALAVAALFKRSAADF